MQPKIQGEITRRSLKSDWPINVILSDSFGIIYKCALLKEASVCGRLLRQACIIFFYFSKFLVASARKKADDSRRVFRTTKEKKKLVWNPANRNQVTSLLREPRGYSKCFSKVFVNSENKSSVLNCSFGHRQRHLASVVTHYLCCLYVNVTFWVRRYIFNFVSVLRLKTWKEIYILLPVEEVKTKNQILGLFVYKFYLGGRRVIFF